MVGTRTLHKLNATRVKALKQPGTYEDGGGLRLVVKKSGVRHWVMRITLNGRRVNRGLGGYPTVSLEQARRKAAEIREGASEGQDVGRRRRRRQGGVTFAEAFEEMFAIRQRSLANGKHIAQWQSTMQTYVFPVIGDRSVANVEPADILLILEPIWFDKPETAKRVLQRIEATFKAAILRGYRDKASPCIGVAQELGTGHRTVKHHRALDYRDVPEFVALLQSRATLPATRLCFAFLILTACRSGEARLATWSEIDRAGASWTLAPERLKGRKPHHGPHIVPLSRQALTILDEAAELGGGDLVFPANRGRPLSDNTLSKLMRDDQLSGTPHGFRSAFKTWCAESGVPDEVSEAALAHVDSNAVRAAYRRTAYLEERREVMELWANFAVQSSCADDLPGR